MAGTVLFWCVAAAMAAIALAFVVPGLARPARRRGSGASRAALNAAVYEGQLADLDRDLRRRAAAARRNMPPRPMICAAVCSTNHGANPMPRTQPPREGVAVAAVLMLPVAAAPIYLAVGHPEAAEAGAAAAFDASRSVQTRADAEAFVAQLEAHVGTSAGDARAWALLGAHAPGARSLR